MNLNESVAKSLRDAALHPSFPKTSVLLQALRLLAKWRSHLLDEMVVKQHGTIVQGGPFAGMDYTRASEGSSISRRLGFYETEIIPYVEKFIQHRFSRIINVGCAEGYYAVGFALRNPTALVDAYDISEKAQERCRALAALNRVGERVSIHGAFQGKTLERYGDEELLLVIDIEGAEDEILLPAASEGFRTAHIIVECHENLKPGVCDRIADRFSGTHVIERVQQRLTAPDLPSWFDKLDHLDQLLATWEWRSGSTPWLVMSPKQA